MAIVSYQGLWNSEANSQTGYTMLVNKNPRRNPIKRSMNRMGFRAVTALFGALVGAAPGATVTKTHTRVQRPTDTGLGGSGGLMAIETVTDINRTSTSADVTALLEMVYNVKEQPTTYPKPYGANSSSAQNFINPR